jgi:hypothetical protein
MVFSTFPFPTFQAVYFKLLASKAYGEAGEAFRDQMTALGAAGRPVPSPTSPSAIESEDAITLWIPVRS